MKELLMTTTITKNRNGINRLQEREVAIEKSSLTALEQKGI